MERLHGSRWLPLVLAACAAALGPRPGAAQETDSLTRAVEPGGSVSISTRANDVTVIGSSAGRVVVRGRAETLRSVRLEGSERRVSVRDVGGDDAIEVAVPSATELTVRTRTGDVTVRGLSGRVQVESMGGDVRVEGDPRSVHVESVSGDVTVRGSPGRLEAKTVSGNVTARSATGSVDVSTASGEIEVGGRGITDGTFSSASGDVTFRGRPTASASLSFETATGDVTLALPDDVGVSYEITTVSGELITDREARLLGSQHFGGGRHYRLSVGDGSVHVSVQAVSGDVHIAGS
jgi:DUF4097 and DUF4098 domain-containing protein YvlB